MTISALIPWRQPPGPEGEHRAQVWAYIRRLWDATGMDVVVGETDVEPFSTIPALNDAARKATGDYLALCGADQLPDPDHLCDVAEHLERTGAAWSTLYSATAYYGQGDTTLILAGIVAPETRHPARVDRVCKGSVLLRRDAWLDIGGFDERFTAGWGWDDDAYLAALGTLHGVSALDPQRTLFELWHDLGRRDMSTTNPNRRRYEQHYLPAIGDPVRMREVVGPPLTEVTQR